MEAETPVGQEAGQSDALDVLLHHLFRGGACVDVKIEDTADASEGQSGVRLNNDLCWKVN